MKIGYLVQNLDRKTGGGRFAADIVDRVKALGHEAVVLKESDGGVDGFVVLRRGWRAIACVPKVRKLLRECDVIHALDGYPYGVIASLANVTLRKRLIISALGTYSVAPLYKRSTSFLLKYAYRSADKVIAVSDFTKQEVLKKVSLKNIVIINPGIQIVERRRNKVISGRKFILGVGGIKERKGYHISLAAFAKIAKDFPALDYVIVADPYPPFQWVLDDIIKKNNLEKRVIFLHDISEEKLVELYDNAELFILTPINAEGHHIEGFGLVFLEAACAGLPVIGTYGTGAQDAIKDGYNGLLAPQNDISKTAEAMTRILSDEAMKKRMSEASYEWGRFNSVENEVAKFLALY